MTVRYDLFARMSPVVARQAIRRSGTAWRFLATTMIVLDAVGLGAAFMLAYVIRFKSSLPLPDMLPPSISFYSSVAFWAIPVWLGLFALYRLYDRHYLFLGLQEYIRLAHACTAAVIVVIVISFFDITPSISRGWLLIVWGLSIVFVGGTRFTTRRLLRRLRARGLLAVPTVIVGANEEGKALAEQFVGDLGSGLQVLGFIDNSLPRGTSVLDNLFNLGNLRDLEEIIHEGAVSQVVVATTALAREDLLSLYRRFGYVDGLEIRLSSGLFEILTTGISVQEISCVPLMTPQRVRITGIDAMLKSALDYIGASIGLVLLSPVLLAIAILVRIDSPGPIIHRRRVLGREGRAFEAFKFRTMVADAEKVLARDPELFKAFSQGYKLKEDPRVTRLGRLLRRTSLDELPQLFNVLRGEMSLVGPRMIAPDEAPRYGKWQLNLLTVKPGITGPWQVHGRGDIPYDQRVLMSMHYIRNHTIWLDLGILLRTALVVFRASGAY